MRGEYEYILEYNVLLDDCLGDTDCSNLLYRSYMVLSLYAQECFRSLIILSFLALYLSISNSLFVN